MKNKLIAIVTGSILLIAGIDNVSAQLIDRGDGMIYDEDLDITWLADANYAATSGYAVNNALDNGSSANDNILIDGRMGWDAATTWADQLVITDSNGTEYDDWRLFNADASCGAVSNCNFNELGHLYYDELGLTSGMSINTFAANLRLFSNVQTANYWSGTEYDPSNSNYAWNFSGLGSQTYVSKSFELWAWAVRSGDVAAASVPEPSTVFLLVAGMIGIIGVKRRRC